MVGVLSFSGAVDSSLRREATVSKMSVVEFSELDLWALSNPSTHSSNSSSRRLLSIADGTTISDPSRFTGAFATFTVRLRSAFMTTDYLIQGASLLQMRAKMTCSLHSMTCQNVSFLPRTKFATSFKSQSLSASSSFLAVRIDSASTFSRKAASKRIRLLSGSSLLKLSIDR